MTGTATFGDPERFAITVGWVDDPEPRERRPAEGGWSMGTLRLTIGGHVLTRHHRADGEHDDIRWYLSPVFAWLADNWVPLMHEERFAWRENSGAPAATAAFLALRRLIHADDPQGRAAYGACRSWWMRHALRAADGSALHPDVVLRRVLDDIEISWTARQPAYAPDGYRLVLVPGAAVLPVENVAGPLWEALAWFVSTAPASLPEDRSTVRHVDECIRSLSSLPICGLEAAYLPESILAPVFKDSSRAAQADRSLRLDAIPAIVRLDDRVLMFGGVNPEISPHDRGVLLGLLSAQSDGTEAAALTALVDTGIGAPLGTPFEEGYDLADGLLDELGLPGGDASSIDVEAILGRLSIRILDETLETDTIRGVALAGSHYAPVILVNGTSPYNRTLAGRRFTLAHELFHILYDRARAQRVAHTSGPWALPGVEKRANAFAAMLLMPRALIRQSLPADEPVTRESIETAARAMEVTASALIEHLHNMDVVDTVTRDILRLPSRATA